MEIKEMPISKVEWIDVNLLSANDYNPNIVYKPEMNLLKFSILKNGWIQPILITRDNVIIDGFHRATLAKTDKEIQDFSGGLVPVVKLDISESERMLLTIRINRAKGSHIALKMSDIIKKLVNDFGLDINTICTEIGATRDEIDLLLLDNIFKKFKFDDNSKYSRAWIPKK